MPKEDALALEDRYGAKNYAPLPVLLTRGKGVFVWDAAGRRYFDMLSAYSALNQGHNHPAIVAAAKRQLGRLSLCSRAFHHELMGPFLRELCRLTRMDMALPMNSGAEAVETAIKAMRLWGYRAKGIARNKAKIVVAGGNFHGRTTTIVGFSSDPDSYGDFGPGTPGFVSVPYGDLKALEKALTGDVCGFLVEPIQGEAGVRIPPKGYLKAARALCSRRKVLFCADEIQTGLGRTGTMFRVDAEGVRPDLIILGKALSGGLYPVSAVAAKREVLGLFRPGTHGSTYGGNPLACAIALAALDVLKRERLPQRARALGGYFLKKLRSLRHPLIKEARGAGLLLAVEFTRPLAKDFCKKLMKEGVLAKDTHGTTVRFAPPLVISRAQLDQAFSAIERALAAL
ncbi:MAG TPA: ornithine--oxo-acid transaminase [Elusimicrobiota bacterium]|jgi:ornithine--oxo-acid transaminase|nr:ornithine--oxo-acid transaminase [Elusimicrobiota bacterium]